MVTLQIIKPITMAFVPRILNRLYSALTAKMTEPGIKAALLRRAMTTKLDNYNRTGQYTHLFWDRIVLKAVRELLGGQFVIIMMFVLTIFGHRMT